MTTMRKNPVLRSLLVASAVLFTSALAISPGQARTTDFGVRGGFYPDQDRPFLGAEALFDVSGALVRQPERRAGAGEQR